MQKAECTTSDGVMEAVVKFDYQPQQDDELALKVGDIVKKVVVVDEGWAEGELNGKRGMFPDNFVEIRPAQEERPPPPVPQPEERPPPPVPKEDSTPLKVPNLKKYKVTFEYEAANEDELGLKLGDIVEFIEEEEVGWFKGRLNSKVGVFPSNFVEPYSEPAPATRSEPSKPEKPPPPAPVEEHTKGETGIDGLSSSTDDNRQPTKPPPPAQTRPPGAKMVMPAGLPMKPSDLRKPRPAVPPPGERPSAEPKQPPPPAQKPKKEAPPPPTKKEPPAIAPKSRPSRESTVESSHEAGESNFDGMPEHRPLEHVQRPKGPPRKPPSSSRLDGKVESEPEPKPEPAEEKKAPWQRELRSRKSTGPPPVKPSEPAAKTTTTATPVPKPSPPSTSPAPAQVNNEWKAAFDKLKEDFVKLRSEYRKDIDTLTDDLDAERKRVRALEVEVDRLKKLRGIREHL